LECLHKCAEKDINAILPKAGETEPLLSSQDFNEFRVKLAGLTSVTRNYFENLVRALEAGLEDVRVTGQSTSKRKARATPKKKPSARGKSGRNKKARTTS